MRSDTISEGIARLANELPGASALVRVRDANPLVWSTGALPGTVLGHTAKGRLAAMTWIPENHAIEDSELHERLDRLPGRGELTIAGLGDERALALVLDRVLGEHGFIHAQVNQQVVLRDDGRRLVRASEAIGLAAAIANEAGEDIENATARTWELADQVLKATSELARIRDPAPGLIKAHTHAGWTVARHEADTMVPEHWSWTRDADEQYRIAVTATGDATETLIVKTGSGTRLPERIDRDGAKLAVEEFQEMAETPGRMDAELAQGPIGSKLGWTASRVLRSRGEHELTTLGRQMLDKSVQALEDSPGARVRIEQAGPCTVLHVHALQGRTHRTELTETWAGQVFNAMMRGRLEEHETGTVQIGSKTIAVHVESLPVQVTMRESEGRSLTSDMIAPNVAQSPRE